MNEARIYEMLLFRMRQECVPDHLRGGIARYVVGGIKPGGFLCALLSGNTRLAVQKADWQMTLGDLRFLLAFLELLPEECRGNVGHFEQWLENPRPGLVAAEMFDA